MNGSPALARQQADHHAGSRFGQLTFTAVDDGSGPGGWRTRPDGLDPDEQRRLESAITTQLAIVHPIPAFPSPEEAAALPRRLLYAPTSGGAAYWHTAPAGLDATGRPGNAFVHVVLDRTPQEPQPAFRPSDLWRSQRWLTPFGHPQVLEAIRAALPAPPWPDGPLHRARVLEFLLDPGHWRIDVLAGLLDAVAAAMLSGPRVVLGTDSPESGACWIAAVSQLMAPAASRRFHWSTLESPSTLDGVFRHGVHLAVVPAEHLSKVPRSYVVVYENEQLKPGLYGADPHRTAAGSAVPVTPWSVIAQEVLRDEETAERALALQDAVGADVDVSRLDPGWALAMAVARMPELSEVHQDAARLVRDGGPVGPVALRATPELARTHADQVGDVLGRSTDELLAMAADGDGTGVAGGAWTIYLERALDDDAWLRRPEGVELPPQWSSAWQHRAGFLDRISDRLERLADEVGSGAAPPTPPHALLALRLADVAVRCGASSGDEVARAAQRTVSRCAAPVLLDHDAARDLVGAVGPLDEATQLTVVRPAVAAVVGTLDRPRGDRVPPAVLSWLFPVAPQPPVGDASPDPLLRELAAQVTRVVADPSAFARLALVDAVADVAVAADSGDDAEAGRAEREVARLLTGRRWTPTELRVVAGHVPRSPAVAEALLRSVVTESNSAVEPLLPDLERFRPEWPVTRAGGSVLLTAVSARRLAQTWWRGPQPEVTSRLARELVATAATLLPALAEHDLEPESLSDQILASVSAAIAVAVVCWPASGMPLSMGQALIDALGEERQPHAVELVCTALQKAVVSEVELVHAALCGDSGYPFPATVPEAVRELGRLEAVVDGRRAALLEHVVRQRVANTAFDRYEMNDQVLRLVNQQLTPRSAHEADGRLKEVRTFAQLWWGRLGLPMDIRGMRSPWGRSRS